MTRAPAPSASPLHRAPTCARIASATSFRNFSWVAAAPQIQQDAGGTRCPGPPHLIRRPYAPCTPCCRPAPMRNAPGTSGETMPRKRSDRNPPAKRLPVAGTARHNRVHKPAKAGIRAPRSPFRGHEQASCLSSELPRSPPGRRIIWLGRKLGDAGWSSPVARQAHNLKVIGSNPIPATNLFNDLGPT